MKTINFIFILLLFLFAQIAFSQNQDVKIIRIKKVLALELCNRSEFNLCSNFSPTGISKNPEFVDIKEGKVNYSTVYRIPPISFKKVSISFSDEKLIYDVILNPSVKTDTIQYNLTKKQVRKIKKHIKNAKKSLDHEVDYSTDGKIKHLLYNVDFECIYAGKGKTYAIDKNGCDLIIEKEVEIYYITKIIEIKPKILECN